MRGRMVIHSGLCVSDHTLDKKTATIRLPPLVFLLIYFIFQEYEEPVYSYSTYPDRRFSSRYPNILKMSPPFASSEGVSASGDRYQSDGV